MKLFFSLAAAMLFAGGVMAAELGAGLQFGTGTAGAAGGVQGSTASGGALASLGFAETTATTQSIGGTAVEADALGGSVISEQLSTGTSESTNANLGLGFAGGTSSFGSGAGGQGTFGFAGLSLVANP